MAHRGPGRNPPAFRGILDQPFAIDNDPGLKRHRLLHTHLAKLVQRIVPGDHLTLLVQANDLCRFFAAETVIKQLALRNDQTNRLEAVTLPVRVGKPTAIHTGNCTRAGNHAGHLFA
ncbi:hypothetical protein D3C75_1100330 [compost metagenome]